MIKKISSGIALTIRVLKNALLRPFRVIYSKVNYMFSAGRVATAIPGAVKKLPKIAKRKPEKREDYFDWGSIYVAKSLVLLVAVLLVAIPLVYVFLLHPLFTSWWWVRDFRGNDAALSSYSGRVRIYYGEELDELRFEGRLKDGKYEEFGEEYWENGRNKYSGNYSEGQYSGSGILYLEDGTVLYRGEFADGERQDVFRGVQKRSAPGQRNDLAGRRGAVHRELHGRNSRGSGQGELRRRLAALQRRIQRRSPARGSA